jgi:beta-RFAP synthase
MTESRQYSVAKIQGGSRLHFGLFSTRRETESGGTRIYGGLGMMLDSPGWEICGESSTNWSVEGDGQDRFQELLARLATSVLGLSPVAFQIKRSLPAHLGLGSGTQMALGLARLALFLSGKPDHEIGNSLDLVAKLCQLTGRGLRSAIGSHGFVHGGFLVDVGHKSFENENKTDAVQDVGQLLARLDFPPNWPVVVCRRNDHAGLSGTREKKVFETLNRPNQPNLESIRRDRLCRLALLGVLPSLKDRDWKGFGESLGDFNRLAGEPFALWQGGDHLEGTEGWLGFCRNNGIAGVGQSSWGPSLFAVCEDMDQAKFLVHHWFSKGFGPPEGIQITTGSNHGATVEAVGFGSQSG